LLLVSSHAGQLQAARTLRLLRLADSREWKLVQHDVAQGQKHPPQNWCRRYERAQGTSRNLHIWPQF
jgi:hypothetical protein